ncbi:MAG: hypothetical protein WCP21_02275 [Armatimonadota bacterium]
MPYRNAFLCLLVVACSTFGCCAHARVLAEYDFTRPNTGWRDEAGSLPSVSPAGTLWPGSANGLSLRSPTLNLTPEAFQIVELSVTCDQPGRAHLLWQGESVGRAQSGWQGPLPIECPADGQLHQLRLLPFWQNLKRIDGLRLLAAPGTRLRLRSLRLLGSDLPPGDHTSWDLTSAAQAAQWLTVGDAAALSTSAEGLQMTLNEPSALLCSPSLDLPAFQYEWLSVRLTARTLAKVKLQWACSSTRGLRGPEVSLRPGTHTYNFRCSLDKSWAGQLRGLALELTGPARTAVTVQALSLSTDPQGGPDLVSVYAGPLETVIRPGRTFRLLWVLRNEGGQEARNVRVTALPAEGVTLPEGPLAVTRMDHGVPEALTWLVKADRPATVTLQAEFDGKILRQQVPLTVSVPETLPAPGTLPPPVPAAVEGVALAAHYHTVPPLDYGPEALDRLVYRRPYLGDYEAMPEVLDWQINWSLEHGLNAWILDTGTDEQAGTLDAFLAARFSSKMQFCLRWTEAVPSVEKGQELFGGQLAPVLAQPNYLRLQGKPVVLIAAALRRTGEAWGLSDLKALSDQLPVTLVACLPLDAASAALLKQAGYAAAVDLHTDEDFPRVASPLEDWQQAAEAGTPHLLSLQPAWREAMTPDRLRTLLRIALLRARKTDPCALPMIIAGDFNAEASLEPRRPEGFQWLQAIAASVGAKPVAEFLPEDLGLGSYNRPRPAARSRWEFDEKDGWTSAMGMSVIRVAAGELTGRTDSTEPALFGGDTMLDTRQSKALVLGLSVSAGTQGRVYWKTSLRKFSRDNSLPLTLIADGAIHEYRLEVAATPGWRGYLEGLRIDPTDAAGAAIALDYVRVVP